jgi:hypothetical protein
MSSKKKMLNKKETVNKRKTMKVKSMARGIKKR